MGKILDAYDTDKSYPVYGFGAKVIVCVCVESAVRFASKYVLVAPLVAFYVGFKSARIALYHLFLILFKPYIIKLFL